ncbi:MAG: hypothetical protein HY554_15795 [Elusimicrobia bacterium]|nr:hypothetical protein [Elusimicrobiota bacterium]
MVSGPKTAVLGFLLMAAGFWNSTVIAQWIAHGQLLTNNLILGGLYVLTAGGMYAIEAASYFFRERPAGGRGLGAFVILGSYAAGMALMILGTQVWGPVAVLAGMGVVIAGGLASFLAPRVAAWARAVSGRIPRPKAAPVPAWLPKAVQYGGLAVGVAGLFVFLSGVTLGGLASFLVAAAPILGVGGRLLLERRRG